MARLQINGFGIPSRVLKGHDLRREVDKLAQEAAGKMRGLLPMVEGEPGDVEIPVEVSSYTTDRARATVWAKHPAAAAAQAKHGFVSKTASSLGHELKGD